MKAKSVTIIMLAMTMAASAEMRSWTLQSGESVTGEYVSVVFNHVVLREADGKQIKLPKSELSDADRTYVELENPPELNVDLLRSSDQVFIKPSPIWVDNSPVTLLQYTFGARIKQSSAMDYGHTFTVEVIAVAQQVYDQDKYKLISKQRSEPFMLTEENKRRYEFRGSDQVELIEYLLAGQYPRGQKMAESLIVVRDERGAVVAYNTTKNWLYMNLDRLEALPVGAWLDKTCHRVHPTNPKPVWLD